MDVRKEVQSGQGILEFKWRGMQRFWLGILVDYKLKFSYLSVKLIYGREMGMYGKVAKLISLLIEMFDRGLCPADWWAEMENERIKAENG